MSIRPKIEAALSATVDRITPGSGADVVRQMKDDLHTIDASSENLGRRYANDNVRLATTVVFESKHFDGDPVMIEKRQDGLIVVVADSFIFVRRMAFGAREVKVILSKQVTVEKVTTVLDGAHVPGLRIKGGFGMPKFAIAIALPKGDGDPAAQTSVRDELCALLEG